MEPKEITIDSDNETHIASFGYYDGIHYAKSKNLAFTTSFKQVYEGTHYLVCCGDVMLKVTSSDYPDMVRRTI